MSSGLIYLMYHELALPGRIPCQSEPGYTRYVISADEFRNHISYLEQAGWSGLSVTQAMTLSPTKNTVVITFDDGCETDLLVAAPILKAANFGATFYITPGFLGRRGYLSPAQLSELSRYANFDIGSHSLTHPYLTDLDDATLQKELSLSKQQIEQIIGTPVHHFSCPGGRWNPRVAELAKSLGYKTVTTSRIRANSLRADPFCLARIAITRDISMDRFQRICQAKGLAPMQWKEFFRSGVRRMLGNKAYDRVRGFLLKRPDTSHT